MMVPPTSVDRLSCVILQHSHFLGTLQPPKFALLLVVPEGAQIVPPKLLPGAHWPVPQVYFLHPSRVNGFEPSCHIRLAQGLLRTSAATRCTVVVSE